MTDRENLLSYLAEEILAVQSRALLARASDSYALITEADELMAIRLNILRRQDNEAQLELPLNIKAAA